ncbi:serine dehydratase subunit alpha family protein [Clostridium sp. JS66]|uniref:L-cysteine desulfidase family protein n=1 Tax=Clostridium sp. JS66 TaxID=3064705 RepID=UPI00298E4EE7|nr:L-serine ammonia-lyase, iron-sulfur-dependent, subunit alpha [Clostridium sp. JS66]WPC44158.1 L-serine ammonia-lyase, iron-sulfur-dependent, subunit alpha [Clostridium sp. JS66]
MNKIQYDNYVKILKGELIPAMGCTEPIAIAFTAAKAREVLGQMPEKMVVRCSGNIIKNVKGVIVPNSGGQKGVEVAAILGTVAGKADLELQVISEVQQEDIDKTKELYQKGICSCELEEGEENLFIRAELTAGQDVAAVEVRKKHNHIAKIEKNGKVIFEQADIVTQQSGDKSKLNIKDILQFANEVNLDDVRDVISTQIKYNSAISKEGLTHNWGAQVGQTLMKFGGNDVRTKARAAAAAGSDARMNGCALPVVINSGSGNQGITCTMPVLVYAEDMGADEDKLYRALVLTNLISLHQKRYIGNLSAYCGAVSAGTAAACGIAYLNGADYDTIGKTIINSVGNVGGIVCDGAKASCAAKISSSVDAGIMGYEMAKHDLVFPFGEGIVEEDYEKTIQNIGRMGRQGMKSTDVEILNIMIGK